MEWKMNEKQTQFLQILGENADGITLREIAFNYGVEFKTGTINVLITKGLVVKGEPREFVADVVYNGHVIGHKSYSDTVYMLPVAE